jgi:hypothetical protein
MEHLRLHQTHVSPSEVEPNPVKQVGLHVLLLSSIARSVLHDQQLLIELDQQLEQF